MPASTRARMASGLEVAGPSVQMIFARRMVRPYPALLSRPSDRERSGGGRDGGWQVGGAGEPAVHRGGAGPALGDRPHDQRLAAAGVAGDEHTVGGAGVVAVADDGPTRVDPYAQLLQKAIGLRP